MDPHSLGEVVVGGVVVAKQIMDFFGGRTKDRRHRESTGAMRSDLSGQIAAINLELAELRAFVVGPDGENGIRGDVRELKRDVRRLLDRDRGRT
jgi:hypothetical protein